MIDSHCHLAGPEFRDDLDAVIARAQDAGLSRALVILAAEDEPELAQAREVAARWSAVRFSIGVHPHAAGAFAARPADVATTVEKAIGEQPLTRAVGEIGLDYHYDHAPRDVQQHVFRHQIQLARRLGLPIVIHTREAANDTFDILAGEGATDVPVVLHCFTGDREMARRALDAGCYLSFAGIVTFPRALELREVAREIPADRFLIETDSPFLAPVPFRGTRNEPARVRQVAETLAELRQVTVASVIEASGRNFQRVFNP